MERVELEVKGEVPPPTIMSFDVKVAAPVPPFTTEMVEDEVTGLVPPPTTKSPEVIEMAPVPPFTTERVEVEVTAPVPPETKSSQEVKPGVKREPLMRNWLSKVEEALTKIPAKDEVGVRASAAKLADCQFEPPAPAAVSSFAQMRLPLASVVRVPLLL